MSWKIIVDMENCPHRGIESCSHIDGSQYCNESTCPLKVDEKFGFKEWEESWKGKQGKSIYYKNPKGEGIVKLSAKDDREAGISRKIKIGEKEYPYERGEDGSIIIDLEKYRKEQASGGVPNVDMKGNYLSDSKPPEPIEKQRNMKLL